MGVWLQTTHTGVESVDRDKQTVTVRNPWGWGEKPVTLSWDDFKQGFGTVYTTKK